MVKLVNFRRSRIVKLLFAAVLVILGVSFFLPKPTGNETRSQRRRVSRFWPFSGGDANESLHDEPSRYHPKRVAPPRPVFTKNAPGNFEPVVPETMAEDAPGAKGVAYHAPDKEKNNVAHSQMEYGMNVVASDHISVNRTIPDMRLEE